MQAIKTLVLYIGHITVRDHKEVSQILTFYGATGRRIATAVRLEMLY